MKNSNKNCPNKKYDLSNSTNMVQIVDSYNERDMFCVPLVSVHKYGCFTLKILTT